MNTLNKVQYVLPNTDAEFSKAFIDILMPFGDVVGEGITLHTTKKTYVPKTEFTFANASIPSVVLYHEGNESISIELINETGEERTSTYTYRHIPINDCIQRLSTASITKIDHTGFNLPWFNGLHPKQITLRKQLANISLYHTFPKELEDQPWDFILPGTQEEVTTGIDIDYTTDRRPKIEIVSFNTSSIPLMQIDIQLDTSYELMKSLFPEAIDVAGIRCLSVYLKNTYGIDICFVLNELQDDWSHYFKSSRLVQS